MAPLKGVIPALTTPFHPDLSLDLPGFARLVEAVIADGVDGILVNGCTGESWALTDAERRQVYRTAVATARGRVPVVAGCGHMLAADSAKKTREAAEDGCDAALIQPPWYILPGNEEVMDHFAAVLKETPLPVVIYNIPRRTGINLTPEMCDRLADHPKVVAFKESSKDFLLLQDIIRAVGDRANVFAGYASLLGLGALACGAVGYMDSTTPVMGRLSADFYRAATSGDLAQARALQGRMAALTKGFFGIGTFPAGVKAALEMLGRPGGPTRPPIRPLDAAQKARIRTALVGAGLLEQAAAAE
ncbi:dihydrodipicolinate synthase family protein [Roseomonas sp. AR75]|uniref:dihydrodipicolinate synthase family protein n=1 Tax=Roseomonas sp. AR75 TaxID=2562311 RepID=UPI0010C050B2|nr:dihydrodipicolinate synthase family protein [Roseomonas sp. AR75]